MNHIVRNYGDEPNPRKVAAEAIADVDVRPGRIARYRDGCELTLEPGETAPDTCPGDGCTAALEAVVVTDGGRAEDRVVVDAHECIPQTDQTEDVDRCQLCGGVIR
ncbi:hypothetical protein G9C85_00265 [Halorubellus sp. JP-L1]|uniref:hypothetical protein n=1 Tax=Halorubellus sp. JP-L1 TaxID=2715753 RepID=UPI001409141E|nr:hypothetical protein [Halorubellus sp. JP-L1]NHN40072.1 hypothetical protein [Halorubellus sp. JP-L1]